MSYKKTASADRDALFGGVPAATEGGRDKKKTTNRTARPSSSTTETARPKPTAVPTNQGYRPKRGTAGGTGKKSQPSLSAETQAQKRAEAEDYKAKANKCMQRSFFGKPDPVAASTFFKRAADCYQILQETRLEQLYRVESAECNRIVQAWASCASDYTRAAELMLELIDTTDNGTDASQKRRDASKFHKQAAGAWTEMGEKSKAAASQVQAAIALNFGEESTVLSKQALQGMEEAIEAHVPDVLNPYGRYRQTGVSAFLDPENADETVEQASAETLQLASSHMVTRSYAHEPLNQLVAVLVNAGEYASALYAAGAVTAILEKDGISTLSLSRAYAVETVLTLALGDPVMAEQSFLSRHVQSTPYLASRECKLAEDLFRAVKTRDLDALEEARAVTGSNRAALANLDPAVRELVPLLRLTGVARKNVASNAIPVASTSANSRRGGKNEPDRLQKNEIPEATTEPATLQELSKMKTGYEKEVAEGAHLDGNALANELDDLDFGALDSDHEDDGDGLGGVGDDSDLEDDDDVDLR
jgi:hypothetical protein